MSSPINITPYLRTSRSFPKDAGLLQVEVDKAYIDIAQKVNDRSIGIYPTNRPAITGDTWYLQGGNRAQESQRQVYTFTTFTNFNHGINFNNIFAITKITGTFYDGTNWYPLPYSTTTAANCVGVSITPSQIAFSTGGGSPSIVRGVVIIEWLINL